MLIRPGASQPIRHLHHQMPIRRSGPKLIRHTLHIIENYIHFKRIVVRTIDTDFLILLISYIGQLSEIRPDIKQILGKVKLDITIFSARQLISDENGVNRGGVRVIVVQAIIISVISSL